MTGYGRAQAGIGGRDITVEIRSVNHRYFEFSARVPRAYGYLEEKLKGLAQGSASRGKVEVAVLIQTVDSPDSQVAVNAALAREYIFSDKGQTNLAIAGAIPTRTDFVVPAEIQEKTIPQEQTKNAVPITDPAKYAEVCAKIATAWQEDIIPLMS